MICSVSRTIVAVALLAGVCPTAQAAIPFAEDFNAGTAGWRFSNTIDLTAFASGGSDGGGYVSRTFAFSSLSNPNAASAIIFRAQEEFSSSAAAYAGNWISEGVKQVSVMVRHTASEPLTFIVRMSNPANFPGASYRTAAEVPANEWTKVAFNVTPGSPQNLTYEGTDYSTVFSNVGHIQFGVDIPVSLRGGANAFTFDLDRVRVSNVPEPAACGIAVAALAGLAAATRRRR